MLRALLVLALVAPRQDEKGFEKIFNEKDFTGIKFAMGGKKGEPGETFKVQEGMIVCSGMPAGYWYTEKKYKEFTLRFDYRYKRPADLQDDSKFTGNSGYLFFFANPGEHQGSWPKSLEIQGQNRGVLSIIGIGGFKSKNQVSSEARTKAIKPVGEWNSIEIASKGGTVTASLNGTPVTTVTDLEANEGHIAFQSEGAEIHWRNIRIKAD